MRYQWRIDRCEVYELQHDINQVDEEGWEVFSVCAAEPWMIITSRRRDPNEQD